MRHIDYQSGLFLAVDGNLSSIAATCWHLAGAEHALFGFRACAVALAFFACAFALVLLCLQVDPLVLVLLHTFLGLKFCDFAVVLSHFRELGRSEQLTTSKAWTTNSHPALPKKPAWLICKSRHIYSSSKMKTSFSF
jgi:hypothetical protein